MASSIEEMIEELRAISEPVYMSERDQILDYYQDEYGPDWKNHLISGLVGVTGLKKTSIARRFQGGRGQHGSKQTAKTKAEYRVLGTLLPPDHYKAPAIQVDFSGWVLISDNCEERKFSEVIRGSDAYDLVNDPSFSKCMNAYFPAGLVQDDCGPWIVKFIPLEDDEIDSEEEEEPEVDWEEEED